MLYAACIHCIYVFDGNKVVWYIQGYFVIRVVPNVRKLVSNAPKCIATTTWTKIQLQEQSCVVLIAGVLSLIIETRSLCSRIKEKIRRVQVSFQLVNALWLDLLTLKIYALSFFAILHCSLSVWLWYLTFQIWVGIRSSCSSIWGITQW